MNIKSLIEQLKKKINEIFNKIIGIFNMNWFKNDWKKYEKDDNIKYLSLERRFSYFCDYGNNPSLWWNIYNRNITNPNDYGTWWYKFKRSKCFWIILIILTIKLLYNDLPILSLINIMK